MLSVTQKTEVKTIDCTPEKRLFWSIISDYNLQTGVTELIDNALDLWLGTKPRGALNINLHLDVDRQIVTLLDNAGGVREDDLRLLIAPGGSKNSPDAECIGIFGVGGKRAVVAIAEHVEIATHHKEDVSYQLDFTTEWLRTSEWDLPVYRIPEIDEGVTRIKLTQLRKGIRENDGSQLKKHFGETYEWFLKIDNCKITVNDTIIEPIAFDNWAYPPDYPPRTYCTSIKPDDVGIVSVEISAGLILDRNPIEDNYGVYIYCNNRLIVKELRSREVGYFVGSEAGVPHPDASLCRVIVRFNGPAKLMPWNSSKTGIDYSHQTFDSIRPILIQYVSHYSSLSRRLKDDWQGKVYQYSEGEVERMDEPEIKSGRKIILPPLPKVQKKLQDHLISRNKQIIESQPWTLGLIESVAAVDIIARQRLITGDRIAMILLDSNFEISLKEFIVHREDLFPPQIYTDRKIAEIFKHRHVVIQEISSKITIDSTLLSRARHYYNVRNKLIHERATVGISPTDINNYRGVIEKILTQLFGINF